MSASDVRGIVERLMAWEALVANDEAQTLQEAADEIERLTRELEEAVGVVERMLRCPGGDALCPTCREQAIKVLTR